MSQPPMDAAGRDEKFQALTAVIIELQDAVKQIWHDLYVRSPVTPPAPTPPPVVETNTPEPPAPLPDSFSGDRSQYREFKSACELHFRLKPRTYQDPRIKVLVIISCLRGEPRLWANGLMNERDQCLETPDKFFAAMGQIYEDPFRQSSAEAALRRLKQGSRPVEEYLVQFRLWSPATGWNELALYHQFRLGLSETIKDELARVEPPVSLEALTRLAVRIDQRLRERQREKTGHPLRLVVPAVAPREAVYSDLDEPMELGGFQGPVSPQEAGYPDLGEPMELGGIRGLVSPQERQRRFKRGLCFYCGGKGHRYSSCPGRQARGKSAMSYRAHGGQGNPKYLRLPLTIAWGDSTTEVEAMIDSGASLSLMDVNWAKSRGIPGVQKQSPLSLRGVDGRPLAAGPITRVTMPLKCSTGASMPEIRQFELTRMPACPVILGIDWLGKHNPVIDWEARVVRPSNTLQTAPLSQEPRHPRGAVCGYLDSSFEGLVGRCVFPGEARRASARQAGGSHCPVVGQGACPGGWSVTSPYALSGSPQKIGPITLNLDLPSSLPCRPAPHMSLLGNLVQEDLPGQGPPPAPPVEVHGEEEFEVGAILDSRFRGRRRQYLVRWQGYGPEEDSWIHAVDLHASRLVSRFHNRFPNKPSPGRPQSGRE